MTLKELEAELLGLPCVGASLHLARGAAWVGESLFVARVTLHQEVVGVGIAPSVETAVTYALENARERLSLREVSDG